MGRDLLLSCCECILNGSLVRNEGNLSENSFIVIELPSFINHKLSLTLSPTKAYNSIISFTVNFSG